MCTYPEFVQAATGHPPSFSDNRRKTNGQNTNSGNNEKSGSDDDTDSQKGNSDHENDDFNDNDYAPQWHIIPEIGDGACLLRCVSRTIHNTPDMHEFIRADILNHISQNLHNPIPGSGGNTFDQSIFLWGGNRNN